MLLPLGFCAFSPLAFPTTPSAAPFEQLLILYSSPYSPSPLPDSGINNPIQLVVFICIVEISQVRPLAAVINVIPGRGAVYIINSPLPLQLPVPVPGKYPCSTRTEPPRSHWQMQTVGYHGWKQHRMLVKNDSFGFLSSRALQKGWSSFPHISPFFLVMWRVQKFGYVKVLSGRMADAIPLNQRNTAGFNSIGSPQKSNGKIFIWLQNDCSKSAVLQEQQQSQELTFYDCPGSLPWNTPAVLPVGSSQLETFTQPVP